MHSLILQAAILLGSATAYQAQQPLQAESIVSRKPLVDSEELQSKVHAEDLLARAKDLYDIAKLSEAEYNHPTRVIGSAGHHATLAYILANLETLGGYYNVSTQSLPAFSGDIFESRLVFGSEVLNNATAMSLTPGTKDNEPVHGDLVLVEGSGCSAEDYPKGVKGNIALIQRGECAFGNKSALAGKAGAKAVIVHNTEKGPLHGTLGEPLKDHVATFGLSFEEAAPYLKKLKQGKRVDVIAYINAVVSTIKTKNIVAQTVGGDPENCVMLGAHSDSVAEGPGINDDGSGTISLLEVASHLSKYSVNNCVRFAWWAAEEEGLVGSYFYAEHLSPEENNKVRLFMDYDMMASPNFAYQIYNATNDHSPKGSEELRDFYIDWYEAHGLNYSFIPFDGRSDYVGFLDAGIPAGGIATGAEVKKTKKEVDDFGGKAGDQYDECYHQLCDDVGNVNLTAWEVNTKLIAHSVATYALSLEDFPKREKVDSVRAASKEVYGLQMKYRGSRLWI